MAGCDMTYVRSQIRVCAVLCGSDDPDPAQADHIAGMLRGMTPDTIRRISSAVAEAWTERRFPPPAVWARVIADHHRTDYRPAQIAEVSDSDRPTDEDWAWVQSHIAACMTRAGIEAPRAVRWQDRPDPPEGAWEQKQADLMAAMDHLADVAQIMPARSEVHRSRLKTRYGRGGAYHG